jgi:transcriptional regulator with XRE-family HTH domain
MDLVRIGRVVRTLRRRRTWRQVDLARRAVSSQQVVSLVECGHADRVGIRTLSRVLRTLDAELEIGVRWRGGQLDRLLDAGHAQLVTSTAARLRAVGWTVQVEATYAFGRESGSIDILAYHAQTGALLVIEVKTELLSIESTLRKHDEKVRLAGRLAAERFGWRSRGTSRLLVLPRTATTWRHVGLHAPVFDDAYGFRGRRLEAWLRAPVGQVGGILFLADTKHVGTRGDVTGRRRVRVEPARLAEHDSGLVTGMQPARKAP